METQIVSGTNLGYIPGEHRERLSVQIAELERNLNGLITSRQKTFADKAALATDH